MYNKSHQKEIIMNNVSDIKTLKGGSVLDNVSYLRRYINSSDRSFISKDFTQTNLGISAQYKDT